MFVHEKAPEYWHGTSKSTRLLKSVTQQCLPNQRNSENEGYRKRQGPTTNQSGEARYRRVEVRGYKEITMKEPLGTLCGTFHEPQKRVADKGSTARWCNGGQKSSYRYPLDLYYFNNITPYLFNIYRMLASYIIVIELNMTASVTLTRFRHVFCDDHSFWVDSATDKLRASSRCYHAHRA